MGQAREPGWDDGRHRDRKPFGNPNWQSNQLYGTDNDTSPVREVLFRDTWSNDKDGLDKPDRPPEPVAQVRVLPGALLCRGRG